MNTLAGGGVMDALLEGALVVLGALAGALLLDWLLCVGSEE